MSTVTVYLSTPKAYVEPPSALDDAGFLAGLKSGWNALTSAVVVVLTVVGAVLPFAVVALLVGIPVWLLVRRTLRSRTAAPAPAGPLARHLRRRPDRLIRDPVPATTTTAGLRRSPHSTANKPALNVNQARTRRGSGVSGRRSRGRSR